MAGKNKSDQLVLGFGSDLLNRAKCCAKHQFALRGARGRQRCTQGKENSLPNLHAAA